MDYYIVNGELYHHGVKGQKWGVRRYQNKDGLLTLLGKRRKDKVIKDLEKQRDNLLQRASAMKDISDMEKMDYQEALAEDKRTGQRSWAGQTLRDSYKASGRDYINSLYEAEICDRYIEAYKNDSIKIGKDYIVKKGGKSFELTESGRRKENEIVNAVTSEFMKKHSKEIKEYQPSR